MASDDSDVGSSSDEEMESKEKPTKKKKKSDSSKLVTMTMINKWSKELRVSQLIVDILKIEVMMEICYGAFINYHQGGSLISGKVSARIL